MIVQPWSLSSVNTSMISPVDLCPAPTVVLVGQDDRGIVDQCRAIATRCFGHRTARLARAAARPRPTRSRAAGRFRPPRRTPLWTSGAHVVHRVGARDQVEGLEHEPDPLAPDLGSCSWQLRDRRVRASRYWPPLGWSRQPRRFISGALAGTEGPMMGHISPARRVGRCLSDRHLGARPSEDLLSPRARIIHSS